MKPPALLFTTLCCTVVAAARAHAQVDTGESITYRVKPGDTLDLVAAELYGDHGDVAVLVAENKLQHPRSLHPGERIKLPVTREIATAKGDSFESVAATYLGDARRAMFLAEFNGMSIDDSPRLPVGVTMLVPICVNHTALAPEGLASISTTYFGDTKQVELIRSYNFLDKATIDKGESILVPMLNIKVREVRLPPLDADAKARVEQHRKAVELAAIALPRARAALALGDFAGIRTTLARVADELDFLDANTAIEIALLVGKADVAFDDSEHAMAELAQVLDRRPRYTLSSYAESPKVIAAWKKAGGHVDGE